MAGRRIGPHGADLLVGLPWAGTARRPTARREGAPRRAV